MALALAEAAKGIGKTAPNPPVGAVVVANHQQLGSGWHRQAGAPHAEREAMADAAQRHGPAALQGATVYVTLEPCSSHGRTPPCTAGLIETGISRVVYACRDIDPRHQGRADALLRAAGIEVVSGVGETAALALLRPFFKTRRTGLPWVIWKTGMSLDGRITRPPGEAQWLTSPASRHDVQQLRSQVDAILTSGETVRQDRPALTIRAPEWLAGRPQPWRVVVTDHPASLPANAPLFTDPWRERTLLRSGADLTGVLRGLVAEQGVLSVLVEAGGTFSAAMFAQGLIDEVVVYLAPLLCGGGVPALGGPGLPATVQLDEVAFHQIGDDVRLRARVVKPTTDSDEGVLPH